jgi:hypothetical protein
MRAWLREDVGFVQSEGLPLQIQCRGKAPFHKGSGDSAAAVLGNQIRIGMCRERAG